MKKVVTYQKLYNEWFLQRGYFLIRFHVNRKKEERSQLLLDILPFISLQEEHFMIYKRTESVHILRQPSSVEDE